MATSYNVRATVETTATTATASSAFSCKEMFLIANDGLYDITFNLDAATTEPGAFTVKAGEKFTSLPIKCMQTLHYKSIGGSSAFRVWGGA
jgi:hypothetical protein